MQLAAKKAQGRVNVALQLTFIDYRQFLEFFNLTEKDIPKAMVEHMHQENTLYVGNSILTDVDPIDTIRDPWFRNDRIGCVYSPGWDPHLIINIPLCKRCLRKIRTEMKHENIKFLRRYKSRGVNPDPKNLNSQTYS